MANTKKCIFKITSNVINLDESGKPDGAPEKDEFSVAGSLKTEKGGTTLSYKETREGSSVLCEITVKESSVEVKRRGDVSCDMIFAQGKKHETIYSVPPFSFDMTIDTVRIENGISEENGSLSLLYDMTVGGAKKRCRMKIKRED